MMWFQRRLKWLSVKAAFPLLGNKFTGYRGLKPGPETLCTASFCVGLWLSSSFPPGHPL